MLIGSASQLAAQPRYILVDLGPAGQTSSFDDIMGINSSGQIAFWRADADGSILRPARYQDGVFTDLGLLANDTAGKAFAINDAGTIVGASGAMAGSGSVVSFDRVHGRGFIYTNGPAQGLAAVTAAYAINQAGQIVGEIDNPGLVDGDFDSHPFLYSGGVLRDLGSFGGTKGRARGINASGQIVGSSTTAAGERRAFIYENNALRDLGTLIGSPSEAEAINASGQIVGYTTNAPNQSRAFLYEQGRMTELPAFAGAINMRAFGINSSGTIIGWGNTSTFSHPFVYANGVMQDLTTLVTLPTIFLPGTPPGFFSLTTACGINDSGRIVGVGPYIEAGANITVLHAFLAVPAAQVTPAAATISEGSTVVLEATPAFPARSYQWLRNGAVIPGATGKTLTTFEATAALGGTYTCRFTDANDQPFLSADATLKVQAAGAVNPGRVLNISVLTSLAGSSDFVSVGAVVGGMGTSGTMPLLARAGGPSLAAFGLSGLLPDPKLEFFSGATKFADNDNWGGDAALVAVSTQVGAFSFASSQSRDSALYFPAATSGDKSIRVSAATPGSGSVIVELYDATPASEFTSTTPRLVNFSVLKNIGARLTAGFVVGGTSARTLLIRAVGPTLAAFDIGGLLADPRLTLFAGPARIAENDNWSDGPTAAFLHLITAQVGAFFLPNDSTDAALLVTLSPGNYSVVLEGAGSASGTALLEVYELP